MSLFKRSPRADYAMTILSFPAPPPLDNATVPQTQPSYTQPSPDATLINKTKAPLKH